MFNFFLLCFAVPHCSTTENIMFATNSKHPFAAPTGNAPIAHRTTLIVFLTPESHDLSTVMGGGGV